MFENENAPYQEFDALKELFGFKPFDHYNQSDFDVDMSAFDLAMRDI